MGIKIRGLNLGHLGMDYERLVFPHPEFMLDTKRRELQKVWYECPVMSYIIEHPDGLILWETGVAPTFPDEWLAEWLDALDMSEITPERCLEGQLKSLGLAPEDFSHVIQGHLHCDHAGSLRLFEEAGATIVCHEDEYKHTMQLREDANFFIRKDWNFLARQRPATVYGDQEIMKDLWLISLPGHTPGTIGLLTRLDDTGWILLTSDALFTHHSYGPPAVGSPIVWDAERWAVSVEKIRKVAADRDALLFPGHDETAIKHSNGAIHLEQARFFPGYVYE